jgi:hypothetical protein
MSVIINGDTGVSGVDGSAATPSFQGTDTNTGIFYPAADTIAFAEGGTEVMRIDSSGNVGIGTASPSTWSGAKLVAATSTSTSSQVVIENLSYATGQTIGIDFTVAGGSKQAFTRAVVENGSTAATALTFGTASGGNNVAERMRIDSSGYAQGTVNGLSAGRMQAYQYYRLNSAVVGSNATGAQSIFGVGVTLVGSTQYEFEGLYILSKSAGATAHNFLLGFGGTATVNNIIYEAIGGYIVSATPSGPLTTSTSAGLGSVANSTAATQVTTGFSAVAISLVYIVKGTVSINAGGTFIPQYSLSAAPGGAYTTQIGSYFKISPLAASGSNVNVGSWA